MVAVDYPIIHCYSGIRWLVTDYVDFCQLNLLKNSEIHWFQFIMNSSSHHTAMNYGSRSALFEQKLLIILILVTRQQRAGRGRRAYSWAVADKQRRKKSVLYWRCECASCRSRSRPVSDVWRHLDSSYSHSRPHHGRRQEGRWQL